MCNFFTGPVGLQLKLKIVNLKDSIVLSKSVTMPLPTRFALTNIKELSNEVLCKVLPKESLELLQVKVKSSKKEFF